MKYKVGQKIKIHDLNTIRKMYKNKVWKSKEFLGELFGISLFTITEMYESSSLKVRYAVYDQNIKVHVIHRDTPFVIPIEWIKPIVNLPEELFKM